LQKYAEVSGKAVEVFLGSLKSSFKKGWFFHPFLFYDYYQLTIQITFLNLKLKKIVVKPNSTTKKRTTFLLYIE
jgi:hypothetical protein